MSSSPKNSFHEYVVSETIGSRTTYSAFGQRFQFFSYSGESNSRFRFSECDGRSGLILPESFVFQKKVSGRFDSDLHYEMEHTRCDFSEDDQKHVECSGIPAESDEKNKKIRHEHCHILQELLNSSFTTDEEKEALAQIKIYSGRAPAQPVSFYMRPEDPMFVKLQNDLSGAHPAMLDVIDFLIDELALSGVQSKPGPRPILLVGPPGAGKTYFANDLASHLDAPFFSLSMATADSPWSLTGNNSSWKQGKPSNILEKIAASNAKAGVIFIDELTSTKADSARSYPVLPVLLELLDPEQSSRFKDLYFDFEMDLSGWLKILACNSLHGLPPAIIDRCEVIQIQRPAAEQQLQVIKLIAAKLPARFSSEALAALNKSSRSIRQIGADLRKLAAKALRNGGQEVMAIDVRRLHFAQTRLLENPEEGHMKKIVH